MMRGSDHDLNAEKSHHADNFDDNCYTSML